MLHRCILVVAAVAFGLPAHADETVPRGKVAFLGIHLMNNAGDLDDADERARIDMVERLIADTMVERGFTLVDTSPVADDLARISNVSSCNGCDLKLAAELGADYSLTGMVQKTSELILSQNLYLRDAGTGVAVRQGVVDIRGNTDESWSRGYGYLLRNIIFRGEPAPSKE